MIVNIKPTEVKVSTIGAGNTFKFADSDGVTGDFLVMRANSCFRIVNNSTPNLRVDGYENVLLYNIKAKCFGLLPSDTLVIPTTAELNING